LDRAARLGHRARDVGERQRGHESWKALRMARAKFRHGIVADTREIEADLAGGEVLDRGIWERDDLAIVAERIHLAEALVEIEPLLHAAQARRDVAEPRRDAVHLLEEFFRSDVAIDVDDGLVRHCSSLSLRPHPEERACGTRATIRRSRARVSKDGGGPMLR